MDSIDFSEICISHFLNQHLADWGSLLERQDRVTVKQDSCVSINHHRPLAARLDHAVPHGIILPGTFPVNRRTTIRRGFSICHLAMIHCDQIAGLSVNGRRNRVDQLAARQQDTFTLMDFYQRLEGPMRLGDKIGIDR